MSLSGLYGLPPVVLDSVWLSLTDAVASLATRDVRADRAKLDICVAIVGLRLRIRVHVSEHNETNHFRRGVSLHVAGLPRGRNRRSRAQDTHDRSARQAARGIVRVNSILPAWRTRAAWISTVFARELPPRSAEFNAENRLYSFALTMPRMLSFGQIAPRQMAGPHPPDFVLLC
jgi:hypothetical protein